MQSDHKYEQIDAAFYSTYGDINRYTQVIQINSNQILKGERC